MNTWAEKQRLRKEMLARRAELTARECHQAGEQICVQVLTLPAWQQAQSVGIYLALTGEVETEGLITSAWAQGKTVAAPVVKMGDHSMAFYAFDHFPDLEKGPFKLRQPKPLPGRLVAMPDLLLIPALAFDVHGRRLGFGQGFYDRYLKTYKGWRLGLAFSWQVVPHLPATAHDEKVTMIVTEKRRHQAGSVGSA